MGAVDDAVVTEFLAAIRDHPDVPSDLADGLELLLDGEEGPTQAAIIALVESTTGEAVA